MLGDEPARSSGGHGKRLEPVNAQAGEPSPAGPWGIGFAMSFFPSAAASGNSPPPPPPGIASANISSPIWARWRFHASVAVAAGRRPHRLLRVNMALKESQPWVRSLPL